MLSVLPASAVLKVTSVRERERERENQEEDRMIVIAFIAFIEEAESKEKIDVECTLPPFRFLGGNE